jgi:hypothetical protein
MYRNIIFLLLGLLLGAPTWAAGTSRSLYLNLGNHTEFYNAVQNNDSGGLRKLDFAPTVGLGLVLPAFESWNMLPEINWVLPKTYEDSHIIVHTLMYRFDMGWDVLDWLRWRAGTSIMHLNQQGRGGSTKENNGNGTSNFYYPSENRSSLNNTLDFGLEGLFDQYGVRLQTYTYSVFKKEQRQISYTLFFTYYWGK